MLKPNKIGKQLLISLLMAIFANTALAEGDRIAEGKELAFDRKKGNCLACHMIADGPLPGNTAPPLLAMKARFPDYKVLVQQIQNPLTKNQNSLMPPFGLHNILTDDEINKIAEYLYTL